jgi:uncharacterized protein (DUF849 family)
LEKILSQFDELSLEADHNPLFPKCRIVTPALAPAAVRSHRAGASVRHKHFRDCGHVPTHSDSFHNAFCDRKKKIEKSIIPITTPAVSSLKALPKIYPNGADKMASTENKQPDGVICNFLLDILFSLVL